MNNFGIASFSLFAIDAWKHIYKTTIFIVAFIHKIKVFSEILIYTADVVFFTYFLFSTLS